MTTNIVTPDNSPQVVVLYWRGSYVTEEGPCSTDGWPACSSSFLLARLGPTKILLIRQCSYGLETESVINGTNGIMRERRGGCRIFFSRHSYMYLVSFATFRKATVICNMCVCLSICPYCITRRLLDAFSWNLTFDCLEICREKKLIFIKIRQK